MSIDEHSTPVVVARGGMRGLAASAAPVALVRAAEADLIARLPDGALMARAARGIATICAQRLVTARGRVYGSRVVLLVGSGDNGGDALYAGAWLVGRGARVRALLAGSRHHERGAAALVAAGGTLCALDPSGGGIEAVIGGLSYDDSATWPLDEVESVFRRADLVLDGLLGIGGRGGLRGAAAILAVLARCTEHVIAVDLPSGLDADTGAVEGIAVRADETVTLGVLKPGLLLPTGREHAGPVTVVDIGLGLSGPVDVMTVDEAGRHFGAPGPAQDKYTRGVVGISAGSARYPGAGVLCTGAARHGPVGMVRYAGPAAVEVVAHWPDVVASTAHPSAAGTVQCWVVGPGRGTDDEAVAAVLDALTTDVPVVLDADALTVVAEHEEVRAAIRARTEATVLTPHAGEFARLGGDDPTADRIAAVRALADRLGAVILLKGTSTVVAAPSSRPAADEPAAEGGWFAYSPLHDAAAEPPAYLAVVLAGPPELATAGSGDVLAGLVGAALAHRRAVAESHSARRRYADYLGGPPVGDDQAARAVAAAAYLHGVAGQIAAEGGRAVAALDVLRAVPEAVARVRRSSI